MYNYYKPPSSNELILVDIYIEEILLCHIWAFKLKKIIVCYISFVMCIQLQYNWECFHIFLIFCDIWWKNVLNILLMKWLFLYCLISFETYLKLYIQVFMNTMINCRSFLKGEINNSWNLNADYFLCYVKFWRWGVK